MGVLSNKISREDLKPGDHIYSWRQFYIYAHHGIYIGEGRVIHFTRGAGPEIGTGTFLDHIIMSSSPYRSLDNPCPNCGNQSRVDGVILSCIDCFLMGGDVCKFEYGVTKAFFLAKVRGGTCTLAESDPPEDVLHRASLLLEKGFGVYDVVKNNCEDFAIYCKTGLLVFTSGQAGSFLAAATAKTIFSSPFTYLPTSFSGLAAVGFGMYFVSRFVSHVGVRRDVSKIPGERLVSASILDEPAASTSTSKKRFSNMARYNFYVVFVGRQTGIFTNWDDVKLVVDGYPNACFKGFRTLDEAQTAYATSSYRPAQHNVQLVPTANAASFMPTPVARPTTEQVNEVPTLQTNMAWALAFSLIAIGVMLTIIVQNIINKF